MLAGVGFTVSLLVSDLSFAHGSRAPRRCEGGRPGRLSGLGVAGCLLLRARNRHYRTIEREEAADADHDGVPDVYQQDGRGAATLCPLGVGS